MGNRKYLLITLLVPLVLITVALILFLRVKTIDKTKLQDVPQQITRKTDVPPDLYPGQSIDIEDERLLRGRFDKFENGKLYLWIGSQAPVVKDYYEVVTDAKTVYNCIPRYTVVEGQKIDNLEMYLDTSRLNTDIVPEGKTKEWFLSTVKRGEAVEVRSVSDGNGNLKPGVIYVYKENCPA